MERYDVIVLGCGPAGVSAAITAKVRNKRVLLIGSRSISAKVEKAHEILNYPGLPEISGSELAQRLRSHVTSMDIPVIEDKISAAYAMGSYYALQGATEMYEANALIIATGVVNDKGYPGEQEYLGKGVSYCATCDAALYKGKTAVIVAFSASEESEARFLAERAEKVYYIPMYAMEGAFSEGNIEVRTEKPSYIAAQDKKVTGLYTDKGLIEADGVFILRESIPAGQLVMGLEMDGAHVKTDRSMATNLKGCFACGDITGTPYQYIKSAGEGNVAALSAVRYLDVGGF